MNSTVELVLKIFSDCIPVKGYKRGCIYDLNRRSFLYVPNSLIDFLYENEGKSRQVILNSYSNNDLSTINEYFIFFENNDIIFWIKKELFSNFPKVDLHWDYPSIISNAIIDIHSIDEYNIPKTLLKLQKLGCNHIQIRSYMPLRMEQFTSMLESFSDSSFLSIEIITKFTSKNSLNEIKLFLRNEKRIKALIFHSSKKNVIINERELNSMGNLVFTKQIINTPNDCHNNSVDYMNVMMEHYTEAQSFHTYFNRKVAIDSDGNIKNCTSQIISFGNVDKHDLETIVSKKEFQKLWFVNKDQTMICKDCEYRYMCTDSRVPVKVGPKLWKHNQECNYNPYIAKWKGEEGYLSLSECGVTVNEIEIKIENEKLEAINFEIWGEG
jgi:SPASM domain peptide maturase of grasp-with-spasm system